MARVISVCEREADVYRYLRYKHERGQRYIVRAAWERRVAGENASVLETLERAPVVGADRVALAQRGGAHGRRARNARMQVRAVRVSLRAPKRAPELGPLEVNGLLARELSPPKGEEALQWVLFTSEAVETLAQAVRVLGYYAQRWRIEDFHGVRVKTRSGSAFAPKGGAPHRGARTTRFKRSRCAVPAGDTARLATCSYSESVSRSRLFSPE